MSDDDAAFPQRRLKTSSSLQRVARAAATPRSVHPPEPAPLLTPYPLPALRKNKPPRYKHWMGRAYTRGQIYSALVVDNCNNVDDMAEDTRLLMFGDEDLSSSSKKSPCFAVCCIFLFLLVLLYIPVYYHVQVREAPVVGWERNLSRDLREYVQPDNVTAIIDQPSICASTKPILLLVIICSSVDNFDARMAIRETWGSPANVSENTLRLGFLLGDTDSLEMQNQVMDESSKYGDVIQEGFLDTYNNLTLKSVMLLKWVRSHCRHARYVMKTDDDMFVNLPRLISFLQEDQAKFRPLLKHVKPSTVSLPQSTQLPDSAEATSALLIGTLICGARPISNARSKWYAPKYMYNGRTYPKYLSGTGYVMSARTVKKLFEAALRTPLFHLEDVYITGMCSRAAKIKPQDHPGFSYQRRKLEPCAYKHQLFTSHHMNSTDLRSVWGHIQNPNLVCQRVVPTVKKPPKRGKKTSICV